MSTLHPIDRTLIEARLDELRSEQAAGRRLLADLEARAATLREQLLRIDGAAQVLAELMAPEGAPAAPGRPAQVGAHPAAEAPH